MHVLVAYGSKHGATADIATAIASHLEAADLDADAVPVEELADLEGADAVVIGSAAYLGHWLKPVTGFVRRHRDELAARPTWLFSSGPLGEDETDAEGRDLRAEAEPAEIAELKDLVGARDHAVFFGALDPDTLGMRDRLIRAMPAGKDLLPEGDFRDWSEIGDWARGIAAALGAEAPSRAPRAEPEG